MSHPDLPDKTRAAEQLKIAAEALREKLLRNQPSVQSVQSQHLSSSHIDRDIVQADDTRFKQHRCFPRLSDASHVATDFSLPIGSFFLRSNLLVKCLVSNEGEEPKEPSLLRHEDDYKLRYRDGRGPR
jgi:hypothetical protein